MVRRTKLTIAYLGGGFSGWQRQQNVRTVQGELEACLRRLTRGERIAVIGAGRTDAGVHAAGQVAHVDLATPLPVGVLPKIMNAGLAPDLRIRGAVAVRNDFHARKHALGKHYAYRVRWVEPEMPWQAQRVAVTPRPTHPNELDSACRTLPGQRDYASFTVPEVARRSTVRNLFRVEAKWHRHGLELHFFGEGFLRYQVRRMAGALLAIGRGRLSPSELRHLIESPTPGAPLPTAPARGLTLERVYYRPSHRLTFDTTRGRGHAATLW